MCCASTRCRCGKLATWSLQWAREPFFNRLPRSRRMGFDLDARWVIRAARAGAKGQVHKKNFLTVKAIRKPCAGAPMVVVGNPPFSATNAVTTRKRGSRGSLRSGEFLFMAKAVALGADYVAFLMAANMKRDTAQARVHPNLWLVKQLDLGTVTFNPSAPKAQQTKLRCVFQVWQRRAAPRPKMKQWNVRRWNAHTRAPFEMLVLNDRRVNLMVGNFRKPGEVIVEKRSIAASLARGRKATYQRAGDGMMYHLHVVPARRAAVLKFLRAPATQAAFYTNARNTKRHDHLAHPRREAVPYADHGLGGGGGGGALLVD